MEDRTKKKNRERKRKEKMKKRKWDTGTRWMRHVVE